MYVNELNEDALETYLINREHDFPYLRDKKFHSNDIKDCINSNFFKTLKDNLYKQFQINDIDLICGGPPCQGFSGLGIRRSFSVEKKQLPSNHLYQDMAYFIHNMKPKIFLFENVKGILSSKWDSKGKKGEIFDDVFNVFSSIRNYKVKYKLIYSKDYGVPQNRPRLLIVGIRNDIIKTENNSLDAVDCNFLPNIIGDYPNLEDVLSDIIDKNFKYGGSTKFYPHNPMSAWQKEIRTKRDGIVMKKGDRLTDQEYSNHKKKTIERFRAIIKNKGEIPTHLQTSKFAQRLLPKRWGNKGPSLTITSMPDDFIHYLQPRAPTVRECARMQTFPDWYTFVGKRTTGGIRRAGNPRQKNYFREVPKFTQIGNAVPVKLAKELGLHFKKILNQS